MSNKIKGRQRRRLSLASDDVHVFDCRCGVRRFRLPVLGNEICETDSRGCPREVETAPAPAQVEPLYASMNTFTVSLKPTANESDRVLYRLVHSRGRTKSLAVLEKYLPEYRSRLFMLLTHQTYEDLATDEGKHRLMTNIKKVIKLAFNQSIRVTDVLINEFILR